MKKLILDTDIGVDCDDAVALAVLLNAHLNKKCELLGITAATTREGATSSINAILDYYGVDVPVAKLKGTPLSCDGTNNYAYALKQKYHLPDVNLDATKLLRKLLSESLDKVTLIAIGPLTNIANLLKSEADEFSSLDGISLFAQRVERIYVMGGCFTNNLPEWNLLQDIPSAQYVSINCPTEMIYLPHEVGYAIKTKMMSNDNPVWYSMLSFAISTKEEYQPEFYRYSWDPVTCMLAINIFDDLFDLSQKGIISISNTGNSIFKENNSGKHQFVTMQSNLSLIEKKLNSIIERGSIL